MKAKKRINIIDLLVIIVAVAAIAVVGASKLLGGDSIEGEKEKVRITFYSEEVADTIAEAIVDKEFVISDSALDVVFGKGRAEIDESVSYIATDKNEYIKTTREGYSAVTIICETECLYTDIGAVFDEFVYGVGHTLTLFAGDSRFTARVKDIEVLED